ncbi:hypothetical protein ACQ4PT_013053 [Festuca glaucescens]
MVMFEQGSMLALEKLHLKFRPKGVLVYYGFQLGIEHITSLRYLRVDIDCKDAEAREVEAAEDAIRGAVSSHPAHPILELRRLGGADVVMDDVDITVDGEGAEGHNDVESGEMVEEELISPAVSPWRLFNYVGMIISTWILIASLLKRIMGGFLSRILLLIFGYAYPAYECRKTVELNKPDIEQLIFWCQYWILVALVESFGFLTMSWLPIYSEAKLVFFVYLWYPRTKGTTYIYGTLFRPYISQHDNGIDRHLLELRAQASDVVALICQKVLKYVASQSPSKKSKQRRSEESQQPQPQQQQTLPQLQQQLLDLIRGVDVFCVVEDAASAQLSRVINLVSRRFKGGVSAHPPAEVGDTLEALKDLVQSASDAEQDLLADASRIADRCGKTCKGKAECLLAVADGLRALGYDATVCKSRWYKTKSYPAGEHEYIDMVVGGNLRLLVDVDFRSALQMATTKAYRETLPPLFVGTQERLEQIVAIVTEAAQQSFKKEGLHVPPWRKLEYMRAKWLSPHVRESSTKKESSDIEEMQVSRT